MPLYNHISGEGRQRTVTDLQTAAAVGQALKNMRFPADKRRIQLFVQQQASNNSDYQKIMSLVDKLEDRQYQNVSDVTKAADIVE
jgi:transcriptional/translational regulatory protein YebC/TACO1